MRIRLSSLSSFFQILKSVNITCIYICTLWYHFEMMVIKEKEEANKKKRKKKETEEEETGKRGYGQSRINIFKMILISKCDGRC